MGSSPSGERERGADALMHLDVNQISVINLHMQYRDEHMESTRRQHVVVEARGKPDELAQ